MYGAITAVFCPQNALSNQVVAVVYAWSPDSQYFSQSAIEQCALGKEVRAQVRRCDDIKSMCKGVLPYTSGG